MSSSPDIHQQLLDAITNPQARDCIATIVDLCVAAVHGLDSLDQEIFQRSLANEKSAVTVSHTLLCVLSAEQREEYADELEELDGEGISLIHESDPELALSRISDLDPWLVLVGLEIGDMEGLEFVALLTRRDREFKGSMLVLPSKGDPFPAVLQSRDPSTGRSNTKNSNLGEVKKLLAESCAERKGKKREGERPPLGTQDLQAVSQAMLAGVRALESHLETLSVPLDDNDDDMGEADFEFDLGGPSEPEEIAMDDDDIADALDGLAPQRSLSAQEKWRDLRVEMGSLSYALSSELRDFDARFQGVVDNELQALRELYSLSDSLIDGVFALMSTISTTYLDEFDRNRLLPGHRDALGKALLIRRGLTDLRRVVRARNRQIQDLDERERARMRALGQLRSSLSAFLEEEVSMAMRPADRLELKRFHQGLSEQSFKEATFACEGLDKYLDSLASVNQRDVLIKHDRELINEIAMQLEGVTSLLEISPQGAKEMVREGLVKAQALRGYHDALDELLWEWGEESELQNTPATIVAMGKRLATFLSAN